MPNFLHMFTQGRYLFLLTGLWTQAQGCRTSMSVNPQQKGDEGRLTRIHIDSQLKHTDSDCQPTIAED